LSVIASIPFHPVFCHHRHIWIYVACKFIYTLSPWCRDAVW
jgi:hypothetical protein